MGCQTHAICIALNSLLRPVQYQLPTVGLVPGFQLHVHSALVAWTITLDGYCWIHGYAGTFWAYNDGFLLITPKNMITIAYLKYEIHVIFVKMA